LLQVALVQTARHWERARDAPAAYAHRVLINLMNDRHRRLARRASEHPLDDPDAAGRSVVDHAEPVIDHDAIIRAVKRLAPRQREVVVLRFFADLSVSETAEAIGSSPGSVKTHSSRALARLPPTTSRTFFPRCPRVSAPRRSRCLPCSAGRSSSRRSRQAFTDAPAWGDPTAQFYVLRDHVSLFGTDVTNPQQSTDQAGNPDVTFGFNSKGQSAFQKVTAAIAHRGDLSGLGTTLNQHFAVAPDTRLITVPLIDSKTFPNGISGKFGADITGGFTTQSASDLATQLRLGPLPINLQLIAVVPQH
jgi:RNA polymerase sigma factor (sigma-70 family)